MASVILCLLLLLTLNYQDSSSSSPVTMTSPVAMDSAQPAHAHPAMNVAPQHIPSNTPQAHNNFHAAPQHPHPSQWHNQSQLPSTLQQPQQPRQQQQYTKLMQLSQQPLPYRSPGHYFLLKSNRLSTRVETALDVRLVLTELPAGISKLRIHKDHLCKVKQLRDVRPPLPPDTLELHVTAFLHSAMKTADDRQIAMKKALTSESSRDTNKQSQTDNLSSTEINDYKPMDGSPMKICDGCAAREKKRLCRSKRKADETEEWLFKAARSLLNFNNNPILDWRSPNSRNAAEQLLRQRPSTETVPNGKKKKKKKTEPKLPMPSIEVGTVGVDLQMRICCYCRHQHEATGFE